MKAPTREVDTGAGFFIEEGVETEKIETQIVHQEGNLLYLSPVVRKPAFCMCENKNVDQLRGNREADQGLCFRYTDSTIPLLPKSEISSL